MDWMKPIEIKDVPKGDEWLYEVKYDGFRCQLRISGNKEIALISKSCLDISNKFPEIIKWCEENYDYFKNKLPINIDGELVILNHRYQANFAQVQTRGRMRSSKRIDEQSKRRPATLMAFDITEIKGRKLHQDHLHLRKEVLYQFLQPISDNKILKYVEVFTSIEEIQKVVSASKCEGIIAKRKDSTYQKGKKHHDWFKIKNWSVIQGILTEYDPSNGYFLVNVLDNNNLIKIGKCKNGLSKDSAETVQKLFRTQGNLIKGVYHLPPAITSSINTLDLFEKELREPNFKRIAPDTSYTECTLDNLQLNMAQLPIEVSNTNKYLWPDIYRKKDLLIYIREISPWMLPFLKQKALTIIRCPDGIDKDSFFQKSIPEYAPEFLSSADTTDDYIVCNNVEGLVWLANHGTIEYHVPFQKMGNTTPSEIVFDLDPPSQEYFFLAVKAANLLKQLLDDLELISFVKTSGRKGLQIYIPIREASMTYEETFIFTEAIAKTLARLYPNDFTIERLKKNRKGRLYIDYVQHAKDKTLIAPYSPRITREGTVSTPLYWHEVNKDLDPAAFTIGNAVDRVREIGCPFSDYQYVSENQNIEKVLKYVRA
ncbi:DNA ligase D [Oceanobacillus neutriphilus]|uniref:DNA ligase (ATP) n=1 Tax=Oceanobacillus neutriphilus TaxID=531815 RepID=A0ABQ2NUC0_9BACI|nr:DNA ligase D [Oceanobacillus neutriphilus]GGP10703.1 bifunctional non-homologous end joining protein LigD [Oceanobacillus neutriphilus]